MRMYLPFGDWSLDGHCHYHKILIDAPSMEHLLNAQKFICEETNNSDFFKGMASEYEEPYFDQEVWDLLMYTNYPLDQAIEIWDLYGPYDFDGIDSWEELFRNEPNPIVPLVLVIDAFIWLMNWAGAEITNIDGEGVPTINNWTCPGFETVGYGCYD